jgi:hypothetical protein
MKPTLQAGCESTTSFEGTRGRAGGRAAAFGPEGRDQ